MKKAPKSNATASTRALTDVRADEFEVRQGLRPVQSDVVKRLSNYRKQRRLIADTANVNAQVALAPQGTTVGNLDGPGSSAAGAIDRGVALGRAANGAEQSGDAAQLKTQQGLVSLARGDQNAAIAGLTEQAQASTQRALAAMRDRAAASAARTSMIAQGVGLAAGAYGTPGASTSAGSSAPVALGSSPTFAEPVPSLYNYDPVRLEG